MYVLALHVCICAVVFHVYMLCMCIVCCMCMSVQARLAGDLISEMDYFHFLIRNNFISNFFKLKKKKKKIYFILFFYLFLCCRCNPSTSIV